MSHKVNKVNKEKGFTIIEVLIVLAIAGLILVVVLIAIPQLQRNQRNQGRQNDASRVATSVSNWVANNNGTAFPTGTATGATAALTDVRADIGTLNQYLVASELTSATGIQTAVNSLTNIRIVGQAKCAPSGGATVTGTLRQFAVQYGIETSSTTLGGCVDV